VLDIPVIIGSVRRGRATARVARYVASTLPRADVRATVLDLATLDLPIMTERVRRREDPPAGAITLSETLDRADAIVIVTPEYNGGVPGVLKNALDYVLPELAYKPVGVVTVSAGSHGGASALASLRQILLHMRAMPIPSHVIVRDVQTAFPADAVSAPSPDVVRRCRRFRDRLLWYADAITTHKRSRPFPG